MSKTSRILFLLLLFPVVLVSCSSNGWKTKNVLSVEFRDGKTIYDGSETYSYTVEEGKTGVLKVLPEGEGGEVDLLVYPQDKPQESIYEGHDIKQGFTLNMKDPATYQVLVTYHQYVGSLGLEWSKR